MKNTILIISFVFITTFLSCGTNSDEYIEIKKPQITVDLTKVPYPKLSDYHFFEGDLKNLIPNNGLVPYKPTSELFTDYALKKRYIWLPNGTKASYNGDNKPLVLPIGSALLKLFYYNNVMPSHTTKIIEARIMILTTNGWIFAEYVFNDAQTEAFLQTNRTQVPLSWINENGISKSTNYVIPSSIEDCKKCHGLITGELFAIGIKPQNLNSNFTYPEGSKNQLNKLIEVGYLENNLPSSIVSVVDYNDISQPLNLRFRSYLDINCAHCHENGGEADHSGLRFEFSNTTINQNIGVGVNAEHGFVGYNGLVITKANVGQSILHYRVNTETDINYRMPPLGRTIRHTEGVQLIEDWINSL
jgi:uncharacterized repeat protein (TIGR03806 family)